MFIAKHNQEKKTTPAGSNIIIVLVCNEDACV